MQKCETTSELDNAERKMKLSNELTGINQTSHMERAKKKIDEAMKDTEAESGRNSRVVCCLVCRSYLWWY